jgi:hypothetical protein
MTRCQKRFGATLLLALAVIIPHVFAEVQVLNGASLFVKPRDSHANRDATVAAILPALVTLDVIHYKRHLDSPLVCRYGRDWRVDFQ